MILKRAPRKPRERFLEILHRRDNREASAQIALSRPPRSSRQGRTGDPPLPPPPLATARRQGAADCRQMSSADRTTDWADDSPQSKCDKTESAGPRLLIPFRSRVTVTVRNAERLWSSDGPCLFGGGVQWASGSPYDHSSGSHKLATPTRTYLLHRRALPLATCRGSGVVVG